MANPFWAGVMDQTSGFSAAKAIPSFAKHLNQKEFRCLALELG
jgi:hypothetical protein